MERHGTSLTTREVDRKCGEVPPNIAQEKTITAKAEEGVGPFSIAEFVKGRYTCFMESEAGRNQESS